MDYKKGFEQLCENLEGKGVFLTVKDGEFINTMTIGWAQTGFVWGRSVMSVLVRQERARP